MKMTLPYLLIALILSGCSSNDSDGPDGSPPNDNTPPITATNNAPTISSTALLTSTVGVAYSYTITASDADNDELTLSATNLPAWLTFDAASGLLTGTPSESDVDSHAITLVASDGTDDSTQSFTIEVDVSEPPTGDNFIFLPSSESNIDFDNSVVNEWSTGTQIASDITYEGLTSWEITSGTNSPEAGNWGTVLAFSGGIDGDLSEHRTLKLKIATTGGYTSFEIAIGANGVVSKVTIPVDDSITSWQDVTVDILDFALNLSSIDQIAVYGIGGTLGVSKIYIAELATYADQTIMVDSTRENDFVFLSSDENVISDLVVDNDNFSDVGNVIFGEWTTGTLISDTAYDNLSAIELTAVGGWGAVLALQGDISDGTNIDNYDVDLAEYTNVKFKVASSGSFERYALSIVSNTGGSDAAQEVGFELAEQAQWNEIDINLEQYGVNLSNVSQIAIFGVFADGTPAGQKIYITDLVLYDSGIHSENTKPSSDDKFVILTSTDEEVDLRVDDNDLVNEGNITFSDWSTGSTFAGDVIYNGLNSFEVTKGNGWGAVLALMGDIYGGVQTYEIDVAQYSTINFKIAATGAFTEYTVDFLVNGSEYKIPLTVSSGWTDVSINTADIPLNLSKLTQIAIFGVGGGAGNKLYVTDLNISK